MSSREYPLRQSGIYRNLPSFDPALKGLKAIICGATGISGFHTLRALLDTPDRWSTVFALSRSPLPEKEMSLLTPQQRARIKHVSIDLSSSEDEIAQALRDAQVEADHIFYYTYMTPKTDKSPMDPEMAKELIDANVPPLEKFLAALPLAGLKPKRILLQTGGKSYGMHIGRVRTPLVESDPQPRHLSPNFYYPQEDLLFSYCRKHPETDWNVIRPAGVIGAVQKAGMNAFVSFAVYAAVQAHKGEPLSFNSDIVSWQFEACHSTARLTGHLSEWAVLEDGCKNQAFNAMDGGLLSWDRFFHELGRWYGVSKVRGPVEAHDERMVIRTMQGGKESPLGYGPPLAIKLCPPLAEWAQEPSNGKAWREIMSRSHGQLHHDPFGMENLQEAFFGDFAYLNFGTLSMNKARSYGFVGFVDTLESVFEMYVEMEKLGMLPKMKVNAAHPLV